MNRSDAENSELSDLSSYETDDNKIVEGGEGNLAPFDDTHVDVSSETVVEQVLEPHNEAGIVSNRSDPEDSEWSNLSSQEPEGTEIVAGDEDNLTPIYDIDADVNSTAVVEEARESDADQGVSVHSPDVVEDVIKEQETLQLPQQVSGWRRLQRLFVGGGADDIARLNNLTQAIEDAPESPVNYVLRAELYMKMREYALAQSDFQRAYELAEVQFEMADWGLLDQVMRDRALSGLEKVQRRLR